jgi:hypothetical protein
MRTSLFLATGLAVFFLTVTIGCGGNASPAATSTPPATPAATPPAAPPAAPSPTPAPPPSGGGGTPTSTAPFQQAITETVNASSVGNFGMVGVSATGDVTIQVNGAQKNSSYTWSFCPLLINCFDLGQTLITDASGNGQLTFHFPKGGSWAGYFSGKSGSDTIDTQDAAHRSMKANLVTYNGVNGLPPCDPNVKPGCNLDPAQGAVTVANEVAHIVVQGGSPNTSYEVVLYGGGVMQGVINTDANGNATADLPVLQGHGATYELRPTNSKEPVVTGFTVK